MNRICIALICCLGLLAFGGRAVGAELTLRCPPEPTEMAIDDAEIVSCTLDPVTDSDLFRFSAAADDVYIITVARTPIATAGFEPCIDLFEPNAGTTKPFKTACSFSASNTIETALGKTGTYTVVVRDSGTNGTGNYNLTLNRIAPPSAKGLPIKYGDVQSGDIGPITDMDPYVMSGDKDDSVTIDIARVGTFVSFEPCIELFDASGNSVAEACRFSPSNRIEAELPAKGEYTILVTDSGINGTGEFNLALQCITGTCTPAPKCAGSRATIVGSAGDNIIIGTNGRDIIYAGSGNDIVYGRGGRDKICGGSGSDTLFGGASGDQLYGGNAADVIVGQSGNDLMLGGNGNDTMSGGSGNDRMAGQAGNDSMSGGRGEDRLNGGSGHDVCDGNAGVDTDTGGCEQVISIP